MVISSEYRSTFTRLLLGAFALSAFFSACTERATESQLVASGPSNDSGGASVGGDVLGGAGGQDLGGSASADASGGGFFVSEPLTPIALLDDPVVEGPGTIVDERRSPTSRQPTVGFQGCDQISQITNIRQRTTLGPGIQLSVGMVGPDGRALSSSAYAHCLEIETSPHPEVTRRATRSSGALTMLVVQPAQTEEEMQDIRRGLSAFFLSRPAGERIALYRWGAELEQVSDFTNFFDSFSTSARTGLGPLLELEALDALQMASTASDLIREVVDDGPAWARSIVVVAPKWSATGALRQPGDAQIVWVTKGSAPSTVLSVDTTSGSLKEALGSASALVDELRTQGVVTFGHCTDGVEKETVVRSVEGGAELSLTLRDALPEEQVSSCDPELVAKFEYYPSEVVEMHVSGETQELHSQLILPESRTIDEVSATKEVILPVEFNMSSLHERSSAEVHLRGRTSLSTCDPHRLSYAVNLERGRERFFISEEERGIGTDKFTLVAMCLDPTYLNQISANALMGEMGLFSAAHKLVEFRINGESQGVYLLLENATDTFLRSYAGVVSVLRRGTPDEVKFPDDEDAMAVFDARSAFEGVTDGWADLDGAARLEAAEKAIDLRRFFYYVAFNSLLHNADWGDEPYFVGLASLRDGQPTPAFRVFAWDNDDILKGGCDHARSVADDPFALIGCAEENIELALFGVKSDDDPTAADDEVYALYVDLLEQTMEHLTEARAGDAFERTAMRLKTFAMDPHIVAAMPEWRDLEDVPAAIDAAVDEKKAAFARRRAEIAENVQIYRASH